MAATLTRDDLRAVYMFVVRNWAVYADDIDVLPAPTFERTDVTRALKRLQSKGLLASEHLNGEKPLTWQSMFDIENDSEAEAKAEAAFAEAFPAKAEAKPAAKSGASGPRYSETQMELGFAARERGLAWPDVAKAAGVKSPSYFSRVLRERFPELASSSTSGRKAPKSKPAKPAASSEAAAPAAPARKWTAEVSVAGQPVPVEYGSSDTVKAVIAEAIAAATAAIRAGEGSDASVLILKQLKGDTEPVRDRSVYVYRFETRRGEVRIGTQRNG